MSNPAPRSAGERGFIQLVPTAWSSKAKGTDRWHPVASTVRAGSVAMQCTLGVFGVCFLKLTGPELRASVTHNWEEALWLAGPLLRTMI